MKTLPKDTAETFAAIASGSMGVETLETRNSDRLDFVEVHVESLALALELAFRAGMNAEAEKGVAKRRTPTAAEISEGTIPGLAKFGL